MSLSSVLGHATSRGSSIGSSENFYDLTITVGDHDFRVQRQRISRGSSVLQDLLSERRGGARIRELEIDEFDAATVARLIDCQNHGRYSAEELTTDPDLEFECSEENRILLVHVRMVAIADHYEIDNLKTLAVKNFKKCSQPWSAEGFSNVVQEAYGVLDHDDRALKDIVCASTGANWAALKDDEDIRATMVRCGQFTVDVLTAREKEVQSSRGQGLAIDRDIKKEEDQEWPSHYHPREKAAFKYGIKEEEDEERSRDGLRSRFSHGYDQRDAFGYPRLGRIKRRRASSSDGSVIEIHDVDAGPSRTRLKLLGPDEKNVQDLCDHNEEMKLFQKLYIMCEKRDTLCCKTRWTDQNAERVGRGWTIRCIRCSKSFTVNSIHDKKIKIGEAKGTKRMRYNIEAVEVDSD